MNPTLPLENLQLEHSRSKASFLSNPALAAFLLADGLGMLGGLFYVVSLPRLVIDAGGSPAAVGAAILLTGAARIGLVLAGGALCDRFAPHKLMVGANLLRAVLLMGLWGVMALGGGRLPAIYAFSLAFGVCEAIHLPARGAFLPRLVARGGLQKANGLLSTQEKAVGLAGPALAGLLIAWMGRNGSPLYLAALGIDALALAAAGLILGRMVDPSGGLSPTGNVKAPRAVGSFKEVVRLLRREASLRGSVGMVLGVNALSVGPLCVGLPVLAAGRFAGGAQALGLLMSVSGGGALIGTSLAGLLPAIQPRHTARWALAAIGLVGVGLAGLWMATSVGMAAAGIFVIAAVSGCANVVGLAQIQDATPPELLGRMMGLLNLK